MEAIMAGRTKTHDQQIENSRSCIVEALFLLMKEELIEWLREKNRSLVDSMR
jgi:hypothetical protein